MPSLLMSNKNRSNNIDRLDIVNSVIDTGRTYCKFINRIVNANIKINIKIII